MAEYIEREAFYQKLHEAGGCDADEDSWADGWDKGINEAIRLLENQPTADVVEVVHGEWEKIKPLGCETIYECSICGKLHDRDYNYCNNCGAKMRKE